MKTLIMQLWNDPKAARKFIVALLGAIAIAVSVGVLPEAVSMWVAIAGPFLTAAGVYAIPNTSKVTDGLNVRAGL